MRVNVLEMEHIVNHKKKNYSHVCRPVMDLTRTIANEKMIQLESPVRVKHEGIKKGRRDSSYTKSDASPLKKIC